MADNCLGFRGGCNKLVQQLDTFQGCPAKTPLTKLLTRRSGVVWGGWNLEAGPPTHFAAPRSSWDVERPAECFSGIEVCNFSRECSPKEGSLQLRNPRCSTYQCPCNSLGTKTQPEHTWWYLWSLFILVRVNIHMCHCRNICFITRCCPRPPWWSG